MPQLDAALIAFGKLIGLMDSSGSVQWAWFGDPLKKSLVDIPANRAILGTLMRALLDRPDSATNQVFDAANQLEWEPVKPIDSVGVGFIWNANVAQTLHLGFGANASIDVGDQKLALGLVAQMLGITTAGVVSSEFGQAVFSGSFPVPKFFLNAATLSGSYTDKLALNLVAENKSSVTKSMTLPPTTFIPWDCARIAAFVVRSWVAAKSADAPGDKGFFYRMDKHLFPMLGDPAGPIQPMTPLDATGQAPGFDAWKGSIFTTADGGPGALTFLWHLRALITGNETPNLLSGSSYFPLIVDNSVPPVFPPANFPVTGSYPPVPDVAGAWLGIRPGLAPNTLDLVIDFRGGAPITVTSLVIARFNNGSLERPAGPSGAAFTALTSALSALLPLNYGTHSITGSAIGSGGYEIDVFAETINDPAVSALNGAYTLGFVLHDGQPIQYKFNSPLLNLTFPLDSAASTAVDLISHLLQWMLNSVLSQPGNPMTASVNALIDLVKTAVAGGVPDAGSILAAAAGIAGNAAKFEIGDVFSLDIAAGGNLKPALTIGPVAPEALKNAGISIATVTFGATLSLANLASPISAFSMKFADLRLGQGGGVGATGLVAQLFPDLRQVQGFTVEIDYKIGDTLPTITGGGKIPIQRTLGPLEIVALLIEFDTGSFTIGVDLYFALGPIQVVVYELGVVINYTGGPSFFLHGLGLSFDGGGIKLSGLFLESGSDYVGAAVVSVIDLFQLSAIGGYSKDQNGDASLFIFASLVAPLGGPPWFFITGIAGGFGYNRNLPSPQLLGEHPFLKVMRGEISFDPKNPGTSLLALGNEFSVQHGQYWIAAGIQFTCFAVINGKVIVAVSFGKEFSFNLLGMLSYGIAPLAYFELDFMVTADAEHFLLIAGMSPNSYIIDPAIFSLQGQFGMGVWYASPHAGDFVVSIGGYHPYFKKPDHYPDLTRVGVKALVYNFIHVDVQCFFACTPQALMAGASVSLYAKFAGIGAGLDVYVDVLIQWDPFFILAELGVTVWFEFMGRHEIGVELQIHTPPFGGVAKIHLFIVSFTISFGDDLSHLPSPPLFEFLTSQLGVPATASGANGASTLALNGADNAGLFTIDVTEGRTTKPSADSKKQEGIDAPLPVNSEFTFTVKTKLPIGEPGATGTMTTPSVLSGTIDLPLCDQMMDKPSTLTITAPHIAQAVQTRMIDMFPAATFGDKLAGSQAGGSAQDTISKIDTSKPAVPLSDAIEVVYRAVDNPVNAGYLHATNEEYSSAANGEEYPLPLAWPKPDPQIHQLTATANRFSNAVLTTTIKPKVTRQSSRQMAAGLNSQRGNRPWHFVVSAGDVFRATVQVNPRTINYTATPPNTAIVNVPVSPVRRSEMFSVNLRFAPVHAPTPLRLIRIPLFTRATNITRLLIDPTITAAPSSNVSPAGTTLTSTNPVHIPPSLTNTNPPSRIPPVVVPPIGTIPPITTVPPSGNRPPIGTVPPNVPSPPTPVRAPDLTLLPNKAGHIEIGGGYSGARHQLTVGGQAVLRVLFFGAGEELLEDRYMEGAQAASTPAGTRQMLFLHQGTLSPVIPVRAPNALYVPPTSPGISENIGIESDTLCVALSSNAFAGHGCVLQTSVPLRVAPSLFDMLPGSQLLQSVTHFKMQFPACQKGSTLILIVEPNAANPGAALDQVRWAAFNATLTGLSSIVGPDRTAFFSTVDGGVPWQLEVDLGKDWSITSIVVSTVNWRIMWDQMQRSSNWDLIDDRVQTGVAAPSITISFEVGK